MNGKWNSGSPHSLRRNMDTPHGQYWRLNLNLGHWCCNYIVLWKCRQSQGQGVNFTQTLPEVRNEPGSLELRQQHWLLQDCWPMAPAEPVKCLILYCDMKWMGQVYPEALVCLVTEYHWHSFSWIAGFPFYLGLEARRIWEKFQKNYSSVFRHVFAFNILFHLVLCEVTSILMKYIIFLIHK